MARRPDTSGDDASSPSPQVKTEKVKKEIKVKQEKAKGKAKARVQDEEELDEGPSRGQTRADDGPDEPADDDDDEQGNGSPRGHKRARVNEDGEARSSDRPDKGKHRERVKTLPRDVDG